MNIYSNLNFKASKVAQTKNLYRRTISDIDLYELNPKDKRHLERLKDRFNFCSNIVYLDEYSKLRWNKVFEYSIKSASSPETTALIAFSKGKPCGILSFIEDRNNIFLDAICAIPQKDGKRINYTGSTLFYYLFKVADDIKVKSVNLLAVADGPFNVVSKYLEKGFKNIGMDGDYIKMSCNKYKIKEQLEKLSSNIKYTRTLKSDDVPINELIV